MTAPDPGALRALRVQLDYAAREVAATGAVLGGMSSSFSAVAEQVTAVVGGSTQRVDQEMVASLQGAKKQIGTAVAALQGAMSAARTLEMPRE